MTFLEIQTDALDLLHELQNHPQYTIAKLKGYINRGNFTFVRKTKAIEGTVEITTVANQVEYDESDAAALATLMIPFQVRYVDGTEAGESLKPWPGGYPNLPKTYSYGTPSYYWIRNVHAASVTDPATYTGIRVGTWPVCGTDDKTLKIDGFFRPATLVNATAEPEIQAEWHDALVYYAVSRMFGMVSHLQPEWQKKSIFYMSEFERMVSEANEFMAIQSDEPMEIPDIYYEMDQ